MEIIRAWLNGCRDYASGASLYNEHGDDPALKRMFAEAETPFKKKRLNDALAALWASHIQNTTTKRDIRPAAVDAITLPKDNPFIQTFADIEELPVFLPRKDRYGWPIVTDTAMTSLKAQWWQTFLELKDLQSRVYEVAKAGITDKVKEREAGVMALKILDLGDRVKAFYRRRDHYSATGAMPEEPAPVAECLDPVLYKTRYDNAMRYARTYRKKLEKLSREDKAFVATERMLLKWEGEAMKYRALLKMD